MNKDDIKKALECCRNGCPIGDCPYYGIKDCDNNLFKDTIDLITEQEKEIDFQVKDRARLQKDLDELEMAYIQRAEELDYAKKDCDRAFQRLEAQQIKQAKIDVLVELRNKCHNYYPSIDHYCCSVKAVNLNDINKMIEELKK